MIEHRPQSLRSKSGTLAMLGRWPKLTRFWLKQAMSVGGGLVEQPRSPRYNQRSERATMRAFLIATALALSACASNISAYTRTDGVPVDLCTNRQRWRNAKARELLLGCKSILADPLGWLSESGRKLLLSTPAWRGMVTFKRSISANEAAPALPSSPQSFLPQWKSAGPRH